MSIIATMTSFLERFSINVSEWGPTEAAALVFYFMIYACGGWLLENTYSRIKVGTWKEPFLRGPFKPMYGFAPVILLLLAADGFHWSVLLLLCFLVPSAVEYVSGAVLHKLFRHKWWNYADCGLQLHGHICLRFSLYWTALSFLGLSALQPRVAALYVLAEPIWRPIWPWFIAYMATDAFLTVRTRRSGNRAALH